MAADGLSRSSWSSCSTVKTPLAVHASRRLTVKSSEGARVGSAAVRSQPATAASGSLSWAVRAILAIAAVLCVASIFAVWANRQLLDTEHWTQTNTKLLENRAIQDQLSVYLTGQLYANVNLAGELRAALPKELAPFAAPAAGGLHAVLRKGIVVALNTTQVRRLWRVASDATHRQLVALIDDKSTLARTPGGGRVVLDLRPIVANLARRFGAPPVVVERLRSSVGQITILRLKTLETMQGAARGLRDLAIVLPVLALLLLALAVGLSRGRRFRALVSVGGVGVLAGLLALLLRSLAGTRVVDAVAGTQAVRSAASAAWSIVTSLLVALSVATIAAGVLVALAGLIASRARRRLSSRTAPGA